MSKDLANIDSEYLSNFEICPKENFLGQNEENMRGYSIEVM
jgi:hypothetical protein